MLFVHFVHFLNFITWYGGIPSPKTIWMRYRVRYPVFILFGNSLHLYAMGRDFHFQDNMPSSIIQHLFDSSEHLMAFAHRLLNQNTFVLSKSLGVGQVAMKPSFRCSRQTSTLISLPQHELTLRSEGCSMELY